MSNYEQLDKKRQKLLARIGKDKESLREVTAEMRQCEMSVRACKPLEGMSDEELSAAAQYIKSRGIVSEEDVSEV